MSSTMTVQNSMKLSSDSLASSHFGKYGGLIPESPIKILRRSISIFISYIFTESGDFWAIHRIVNLFRILQIIGPCLLSSYVTYWGNRSTGMMTSAFLSIFYRILPTFVSWNAIFKLLIACIVLQGLFILALIGSALYYKKNATLPSYLSKILVAYIISFGYLLHPILIGFVGNLISKGAFVSQSLNAKNIVIIIFAAIITLSYYFIFWTNLRFSLRFKPDSLMTVMPSPMLQLYFLPAIVGFIIDLGANAPMVPKLVFLAIADLFYFMAVSVAFSDGGFVKKFTHNFYVAACMTGGTATLIHIILIALNKHATLTLLFIIIFLYPIFLVISTVIHNKINLHNLLFLDEFEENNESIHRIRSPRIIMNIAVDGYRVAHSVCINGDLMQAAVEKWPKCDKLWYMYTKFVIIFPEDEVKLSWIFHSLSQLKLKTETARETKIEVIGIVRERESNLSADLKPKLLNVNKKVTTAKHKLRNVWDLILQGNIAEMESATKRAFDQIKTAEAEFAQLFRQFPNNRFVTRNYARFELELKGDKKKHNEMVEATRVLARGGIMNADRTHEYGLTAFPNFPTMIKSKTALQNDLTFTGTSENTIDLDDADDIKTLEAASVIQDLIDGIKIPVIRGTIALRWLIIIVFFIIPIIVVEVSFKKLENDEVMPLNFAKTIANIRRILYQICAFSYQYIYELNNIMPKAIVQEDPPEFFGGTYDTRSQIKFLAAESQIDIKSISSYQSYLTSHSNLNKAMDLIYNGKFNQTYYINSASFTVSSSTVENAIMEFIIQATNLANMPTENVTLELFNRTVGLGFVNNSPVLGDVLNQIMAYFNNYFIQKYLTRSKIIEIVEIVAVVLTVVVHVSFLVIQLYWIEKTKQNSYYSLMSLPKNVVSTLAENLRMIKRDGTQQTSSSKDNTEMNKQEDNVLKLFATGGTSTLSFQDQIIFIAASIIVLGCTLGSFFNMSADITFMYKRISESAPHINYVDNAYTMTMAAFCDLWLTLGCDANIKIDGHNRTSFLSFIDERFATARDALQQIRFGGESKTQSPLLSFNSIKNQALKKIKCDNKYARPHSLLDAVRCYPPSDFMFFIEGLVNSFIYPWKYDMDHGDYYPLDAYHSTVYSTIWTQMIHPMYDIYFKTMFDSVVQTIQWEVENQFQTTYPILIACVVLSVIIEVVVLVQLDSIDKHIREVLTLFRHCPPDVVMAIPRCYSILQGNFTNNSYVISIHDDDFFEDVCDNLPYMTLVIGDGNLVESVNKLCAKNFGDDLIGKNILDFLNSDQMSNLSPGLTETFKGTAVFKNSVLVSDVTKLGQKICVSIRDITQRVRYNSLIEEERRKSDFLLSSILPATLVPRVQSGEQNISFAVQTATIVFMDIVSFTPWCGSLPASKVMLTLNLMFKKFDALVAVYETMTKIKCIGDCYMAAGGIFSEINNPADHAKQVVSFGLDALDAINELNEELNETLKIRVGINTGGPIVAGVIGVGKPTFEILGPAINMAQQMEHHGVPMNVHISRPVYELIYGDTFNIKERGSIDVKNGKVLTYLVSKNE